MAHKKNGFLNFCFSCIPGAGQMFQGFIKRGGSIMTVFFGIITLVAYMGVDELAFLLPVVWFYGFFDSIHRNSLPDSEYMQLRDEYLFVNEDFGRLDLKKFRVPAAILLIFIGCYSILRMLVASLWHSGFIRWDSWIMQFVQNTLPRCVFSVAIIWLGAYLISGKTKETFYEVSEEQPEEERDGGEEE